MTCSQTEFWARFLRALMRLKENGGQPIARVMCEVPLSVENLEQVREYWQTLWPGKVCHLQAAGEEYEIP